MKKATFLILSIFIGTGASAGTYKDRATVLNSSPVFETVYERYEECRKVRVPVKRKKQASTSDKIIGGILGGGVGSAFGKGSGKDAAVGVGALAGSQIADGDGISEGEIIGGVAGGVIGNQVGGGSGKSVATGAGVLVGSIVGDFLQNGQQQTEGRQRTKVEEVCEQKERQKRIVTGYNVEYQYRGKVNHVLMSYDPDGYVDLEVNVNVIDRVNYY